MDINPQFIVDAQNRKLAVQLDIKTFKKIEKVLEDYALYQLMQNDVDEEDNEVLNREQAIQYYRKRKK